MSFFESFLGGAAQAGTNILQDQMKNEAAEEQARRLAKFQEEIAIERMKTIADMKRSMDLKAGQEISAEAEKVGRSRVDAELDKNNPIADTSTWTPEMEAARNQGKQGLMETMSRASKLDNRGDAAENLGYLKEAQEIRTQKDVEVRRDAEERRSTALEQTNLNTAKTLALKERDAERKEAKDASDREVKDKQIEINERRANALMSKIASGNGGKDDTKEWLSIISEQRKGVATDLAQLRADKKAGLEGVFDPDDRKKIAAKFDAAMRPIAAKVESIDDKVEAVTARLLEKTGAPKIEKKEQKEPKKEDKFIVGKKYMDASGNVKTYGGNGVWN